MSSCLVPYVGVWQHHLLWSQLWGSHISFQSLWLLEAPQLSNLHNLFSNCMQPLQHFQSSSTLYFSLLNTPAFSASFSIFHIVCLTLPTPNSYFFIPSTFFPCTTNPVFFTSQAFCPTDSCRSAGGRMDTIATQATALRKGDYKLRNDLLKDKKLSGNNKKLSSNNCSVTMTHVHTITSQKTGGGLSLSEVYHIYCGVGLYPWAVTMIRFLYVCTQLALMSNQIITHHMSGKIRYHTWS